MQAKYIDHLGNDLSCVNAARVSFDKVSLELNDKDKKLIKYLAEHKHELPFAHTAITLRMTAPIPIRTQCFKHKIGFVENEISRRYVSYTPEYYSPEEWRMAPTDKKQGSGKVFNNRMLIAEVDHDYHTACTNAIGVYERMIEKGVCPEQARFVLPQGVMTSWVWTGSLLAFSRFYNLRTTDDAQKEVRDLAGMVGEIIQPLYPVSWEALT